MRVLMSVALLLPSLLYAQMKSNVNALNGLPLGVDSILVNYSTLLKIAHKYGVDKNFTFKLGPTNTTGVLPKKVYLKMSLEHFDNWMKQVGFQEKKVEILNQFFLNDFQKVCTVKQYIALRRAYVKKYPAYLQGVKSFQEAQISRDEAHPELISLNTPCFRKEEKQQP